MKPGVRLLSTSPTPKALLDTCTCTHIDLALKSLKLIARRLSTTLITFEEESRLLDRLYYKGKNQHRISLFWRHVQEMRRYCSRLNGLDLSVAVAQIRHSFYNSMDYEK